jgi:monovalent cation:proton antiporter-2 (CPA2) family protein
MDGTLLQSVFIFLAFTCLIVPVSKWAGLGPVIGYLIAGVLIGPFALGFISDPTTILHFSEFGVVMMLFLIGMELQPRELWKMKGQLLGLGATQVIVTTIVIAAIAFFMGKYWGEAVVIGMALALSSTAIAIQIMQDRGMMTTEAGKSGFSVLLFQDVAVIAMIALLPALALPGGEVLSEMGSGIEAGHGPEDANGPSGWLLAVSIFGVFGGMILSGRLLLRPLFRFIARTGVRETFTALALLLVVGSALLMQWLGLSAALGAFIAGVVLADSEYRHQLERDIEPFKALLLGLFFISVGMSIDFGALMQNPLTIFALLVGLITVKFTILVLIAKAAKMEKISASLFAIILSQGGEFAFVLSQFALSAHAMTPETATMMNAVVALSMATTPLLLLIFDKIIANRINTATLKTGPIPEDAGNNVLVLGFGRVGQMAARLLSTQGIDSTLIDYDGDHIEMTAKFGSRVFYGDAGDMDLLRTAGAAHMDIIVVAIDNVDKTTQIVKEVKQQFPQTKVLARARNRNHMYDLLDEGVDFAERETLRGGLALGREALRFMGMTDQRSEQVAREFLSHDFASIKESMEMRGDEDALIAHSHEARETVKQALQSDAEHWGKKKSDDV